MIGSIAILGAPSGIGAGPYDDGTERRIDLTLLREQGLVARLEAQDLGDVMPPRRYQDVVKPVGRGRNEDDVAAFSRELAKRVAAASQAGHFILLLGGDCSILLGALLGLGTVREGPLGVVYIDGHADFATLEESPSGAACGRTLALAVGRSTTPLSNLAGDQPLVRPEEVVHIGSRDATGPWGNHALAEWGIVNMPYPAVEERGPSTVALAALERVSQAPGGFWIHADADVLNPVVMPAVDTPEPPAASPSSSSANCWRHSSATPTPSDCSSRNTTPASTPMAAAPRNSRISWRP